VLAGEVEQDDPEPHARHDKQRQGQQHHVSALVFARTQSTSPQCPVALVAYSHCEGERRRVNAACALDSDAKHLFVTSQGSAFMRFRRALDRGNPTEALSAASELSHVGLNEALELCLLLRDKAPEKFPRAALRWHGRLCREVDVSLEEAQAVLAGLILLAGDRKQNAAYALAELLSRRGLERPCETLVAWAREA
jgi:hypothetical protein